MSECFVASAVLSAERERERERGGGGGREREREREGEREREPNFRSLYWYNLTGSKPHGESRVRSQVSHSRADAVSSGH